MLETLLKIYPWFDHPEGMKFAEIEKNPHRSLGHWLFLPGKISSFHRVHNNDEIWLAHSGSLLMHLLGPEKSYRQIRLGTDVEAGEQVSFTVPAGHWQAAELVEGCPHAFGSVVCAPPFEYKYFEIANAGALIEQYPEHRELIHRLTHKKQD